MSHVNVTPDLLKKHFSDAGKRGGKAGTHRNKVRAGHAAHAKLLRKLAAQADKEGNASQAKELNDRAEVHEWRAKP